MFLAKCMKIYSDGKRSCYIVFSEELDLHVWDVSAWQGGLHCRSSVPERNYKITGDTVMLLYTRRMTWLNPAVNKQPEGSLECVPYHQNLLASS